MGRKRTPGLYLRKGTWHVDKKIQGRRLCESTGTSSLEEAEKYLARRAEQVREGLIYGTRQGRTFREAATCYLLEKKHKRSIGDDASHLQQLDSFIGEQALSQINNHTLLPFIAAKKNQGVRTSTINQSLEVVRHLLNLAASEWYDDFGLTWLNAAPKIKLLTVVDAKKPYPLSWKEQERLFSVLPSHLKEMAIFAVNTGCREQEVCGLCWNWEYYIPELNKPVFVLPSEAAKNGQERIIVLNDNAQAVIEGQRGKHAQYVFTYRGKQIRSMHNNGWRSAWKKARLPDCPDILKGVHNLRHTFGRRLRAANISEEDRKDLLGHKSKSITTHYSVAEIGHLIAAANKLCEKREASPTITLVKASSRKSPAREVA